MNIRAAVPFLLILCMIVGAAPRTGATDQGTGAASAGSLQGVWEAVEVAMTGPPARTLKPQPNLAIFAAKHYSRMHVSGGPRPVLEDPAKATADELRASWGTFVAEAGTYEVSGDRITMRPTIAKNPAAVGTSIVYSFKLDGTTLRLTAVSDRNGPVRSPETVTLTRVE
jgi:hypothetical protein